MALPPEETIDNYLELYRVTHENRLHNSKRAWEVINYYIIFTGIYVTLLFGILQARVWFGLEIQYIILFLLGLLIFFYFITWLMFINFDRLCRRMYRSIAILNLIQERLQLFVGREPESRVFIEEPYYVPIDFVERHDTTIKNFVNNQMNIHDRLYGNMKYMFLFLPIFMGLFIIIFIISSPELSIMQYIIIISLIVSLKLLWYSYIFTQKHKKRNVSKIIIGIVINFLIIIFYNIFILYLSNFKTINIYYQNLKKILIADIIFILFSAILISALSFSIIDIIEIRRQQN